MAGACRRESVPVGVRVRGHRRRMPQDRKFRPAPAGGKVRRWACECAGTAGGCRRAGNSGRRKPAKKCAVAWEPQTIESGAKFLAGVSRRKKALMSEQVRGHRRRVQQAKISAGINWRRIAMLGV